MKFADMVDLGVRCVKLRMPLLMYGTPGIGKTFCAKAIAKVTKNRLIIAHPTTWEQTDARGMPWIFQDADGPRAEFIPFGDMKDIVTATEPTTIFFDDMLHAPDSVQKALCQPIGERMLNGMVIPDCVTFMGATNCKGHKAGVTGIITPLKGRFGLVQELHFELDGWCQWMLTNKMSPVLVAGARYLAADINGFAATKDMEKDSTPRELAFLGTLINDGLINEEAWASCVGTPFATKFWAFYKTWLELPSWEDVLLNPDTAIVPGRDKPDVLYATCGMLAFRVKPKNIDAVMRYADRLPKEYNAFFMADALATTPALKNTARFIQWGIDNKVLNGYDL